MAYIITVAINKKENESHFLKIHCSLYPSLRYHSHTLVKRMGALYHFMYLLYK